MKSACPGDCLGILRHDSDSDDESCAPTIIIKRDDGNVGIGITNPGSKLHLFDTEEGNSSTLTLERNITGFGGSNDGCA